MTFVDRTIVAEPAPLVGRAAPLAPPAAPIAVDPGASDLAPLLSVLFLMMDEGRSLVVNITSAHPGAGTSTVARRLAAAAAATGWCRVALLDARSQPGESGGGLVDAVERGESPVLHPAPLGALVFDTGRLSGGGRALARPDSVRKLYGILRDRYALVIVDCPAVLSAQETLTVAPAADETVLVVEAERSALHDVARARDALERRGAGVLGLVMNKSRQRVPAVLGRTR